MQALLGTLSSLSLHIYNKIKIASFSQWLLYILFDTVLSMLPALCHLKLKQIHKTGKIFILTYVIYGEGYGNPLQYPCLENHTDGGDWQAIPHGVAKSQK